MDPDIIPCSSADFKPLPAGKLYHIFFSHSSEDSEWVREAVEKLESPEYGYKCCYAERDFGAGKPVLENIIKCIHTSLRTVLVLSPEYLRSNWCTYEARITTELDIDTSKRILIPVLLRECNVPNFIGRLSYICVGNEHFWDRLVEAIDRSDSEESFSGNEDLLMTIPSIGVHTCRENGNFLVEKAVSDRYGANLIDETAHVPYELAAQVSQQEYDDLMKILSGDHYIKRHGYAVLLKWTIVFIILIFGVAFAVIFLSHSDYKDFISSTACVVGIVMFCLMCGFLMRYWSAKRATLKQMNKVIFYKNVLVGLCNNDGYGILCTKELKIKFFYYDWKPCQIHLESVIASSEGNRSVERIKRIYRRNENSESAPLLADNVTQEILLYFSMEYGDHLASRKLGQPETQRHTDQGECLCQFAESILDDTSINSFRFSWIFGGPSRQPWRRLFFNDT